VGEQEWYVIHSAAAWVWGAVGVHCPDGSQVIFDQPAAMAGFTIISACGSFMRPSCTAEDNARNQLYRGNPAVAIECQVPYIFFRDHQPQDLPKWGSAPCPVFPTLGLEPHHLETFAQPEAAMKWVSFLIKKVDEQIAAIRPGGFPHA
jgi:hypothetical protein